MSLLTPTVWSSDCLRHEPSAEIWVGVRTPGTELPERATRIREALVAAGSAVVDATAHDGRVLRSLHDEDLLEYLRTCYRSWVGAGFPSSPGQDRVVPYLFPTPAMLGDLPRRAPTAVHARAGLFCYDTMTLVGPGTWEAASAAVDVALTAVDLVTAGAPSAYALCRPPGHHVTRNGFGGSCYLNNAAVAAQGLRDAGHDKVAVIDLDAHHGNGTQSLFYLRPDVFYGSVHVDPGAGWFPHYMGFATETGSGPGAGANLNLPLAPGTGDVGWLASVQRLAEATAAFDPSALVVSLGVDAAADDPESPLQVTADGYHAAGLALGSLGLPTVAVQEGGYHLPTLGKLVLAALTGLAGSTHG